MDNAQEATGLIRRIMGDLYALERLVGTAQVPVEPEKRAEKALPALFEEFWGLYPIRRRKGRGAAEKSWERHVPRGSERDVIEALKRQLGQKDWIKDGGDYVPMPTTWLNQKRWLDAVEGGQNGTGKYGGLSETV